ncbi:winged helix-turn-helix transcriptional regulator [Tahibacter amnicola]|uniref:Winged helix-turn-helix domain-containing protein n=1 Tax=Tahibacter amnicola TaxID=2976241 RepID=A0ABY6BIU1_9GAMM|nr:winged helix-turn-helix domain-containing protein [Tahibacter amnicola]UXI69765.1 winged helix-turn-helix domain-containing protein [Tahibacter amnicola]
MNRRESMALPGLPAYATAPLQRSGGRRHAMASAAVAVLAPEACVTQLVAALDPAHAEVVACGGLEGVLRLAAAGRLGMVVVHTGIGDEATVEFVAARLDERLHRVPTLVIMPEGEVVPEGLAAAAGALDFLASPCSAAELRIRSTCLLEHYDGTRHLSQAPVSNTDPYVFRMHPRTVELHGARVLLTPREFDIALHLFRRPGKVLSREALHEAVCHGPLGEKGRAIEVHVNAIRRKLGLNGQHGWLLATLRGLGYFLERAEAV